MKNKNYCKWKDDEVIRLFNFVGDCKKQNIALTKAFNEYGLYANRKSNSVRNYYYAELSELEKNKERRQMLGIDIEKHRKQEFKEFNKKEEYELVYYILEKKRLGNSVRSSCLLLAKDNVNAMIRYQNKFRSLLKQNPKLIKEVNIKLDKVVGKTEPEITINTDNKILNFPKAKFNKVNGRISDEEIKSLFMGLVKLVKKSATVEVSTNLKNECNTVNESLRRTMVSISKKQKEIVKLTESNKLLVSKVSMLEEKIKELRIDNINKLEQ